MGKIKDYLTAALALALLISVPLSAQDDEARYMKQAGGSALLYRGHKAYSYPMAYNGTYFWDGPSFTEGTVLYNGIAYTGLPLNIDASRQDLLVKTPSGGADKVLARDFVKEFTLGSRRFLNLQPYYGDAAPEGYWEVIYDGKAKVVKQVVRTLQQDLDGTLRSQMGYDESTYRSQVHNIFTRQTRYCYISESGQIEPIRRRSQLLKFYKDRKREISRRISAIESRGPIDFDRFCREAMKLAESR